MVGLSFKIDKVGRRYVPKIKDSHKEHKSRAATPITKVGGGDEIHDSECKGSEEDPLAGATDELVPSMFKRNSDLTFERMHDDPEYEASFAVNLFQDGFSLSKPTQKGNSPAIHEVMESLYPYDRTSESFLMAIDWSQLPGDMLNDIPCKYVNGCVTCEVRDFRQNTPHFVDENMTACCDWSPVVHKVVLCPTTESIVKDIGAMAEENWTYHDFLEIEAKILKLVQPSLCLDPSPEVAKEAYVANYNKLKFNYARSTSRGYRTKDRGVDRKMRLAAVRALMKANILAERRRSLQDAPDDMSQDGVRADRKCDSYTDNGSAPKDHIKRSGQNLAGSDVQESHRSFMSGQRQICESLGESYNSGLSSQEILHNMPIAVSQVSSMAMTIPSLPPTPSLMAPAPNSTIGVDAQQMNFSGFAHQDRKDLLSARKFEPKKLKQEVGSPMQPTVLQRVESKDLYTDRSQISLQFKTESQPQVQLSPHRGKISEELAQTEIKRPSHMEVKEMRSVKSEAPKIDYQQEEKKVEFDQPTHVSQQNLQHLYGKLQPNSQQWQSSGLSSLQQHDSLYERHEVKDDIFTKDETVQMRKSTQNVAQLKPDNRSMQLSTALSSPQVLLPSSPSTALGAVSTNSGDFSVSASVALSSPTGSVTTRDKSQPTQAMPLTLTTTGMLEQVHSSQMQPSNMHLSRRRSNSLPKSGPGPAAAVLPSSASTSMPLTGLSSLSNGTLPTTVAKVEQGVSGQGQVKQPLDILKCLVACVQRHGKHIKERKVDAIPPVFNKTPPSWQALSLALADTTDDYKEFKGQKSLANSLVGGNINARKTRFLQFMRTEPLYSGPNYSVIYHRTRLRLVLCGRGKDAMVEAVIQIGDDQDDELPNTGPPYIVLPTLANAQVADLFAKQFTVLLEKDGFELVEDQVQPFAPRGNNMSNVSPTPHSLPPGAPSSMGTSLAQLGSPRMMANQNLSTLPDNLMSSLNQIQFPSAMSAGGVRLQPQGMTQNRGPLSVNYMNQAGTQASSNPLQQFDSGTSQLAAVQQQQLLQRPSQLLAANQLSTQLGASPHNPGQQLPQMLVHPHPNHFQQFQLLQRQQSLLHRKMLLPGGLGNLGNMNNISGMGIPVSNMQGGIGNVVGGMSGINNVPSMAGMNNMGGMSNLGNTSQISNMGAIGQNTGVTNMINQQMRPGSMNQAAAAAAVLQSKSRIAPAKMRPLSTTSPSVRSNTESMSGIVASNQVAVSSGLNMMSANLGRSGLIPIQRPSVPAMGPPRVPASTVAAATGQGYYLNPQLSNNQVNPPQLNTQHLSSQKLNSQQISPQSFSVGGTGSLVGGPQSPQLSSQTLGSVGSITSSPMELQNTNRAGSSTSAAGQGRVPSSQPQTGQS